MGTSTLIEIGPGKGALTSHLLPRCEQLIAIEIDAVLVQYLRQKFSGEPKLTVVESDILKADLLAWGPSRVAGNLPYYITSPILERVLRAGLGGVFLVQKEVAERITAIPGTRDYGYLSVLVNTYAIPKRLFDVPPSAFSPPPKVDSTVFSVTPRATPLLPDSTAFLDFAQACFRYKRKTLRNNLEGIVDSGRLRAAPEAPKRAEQLSAEELLDLYNRLRS